MAEVEPSLAATLLHQPPAGEVPTVDGGPWAYGRWGLALLSLCIGYHVLALLLFITPQGGLAREAKSGLDRVLHSRSYVRATSNSQTWSMFAPNPHRRNIFVRVLVEDQGGETWDLGHDMHGRRSYPYVLYDRMAKVNRRLPERRTYLRPYAAWVCREWEQEHGGRPAKRVHLIKIWSRIPPPSVAYRAPAGIQTTWTTLGYDPLRLPLHRKPLEVYECALLREGQLSPQRRSKLGLSEAPAGHYRPAKLKTWVDEAARGEQERQNHGARPR